jgi:Tfp pilus assembly protein PilF
LLAPEGSPGKDHNDDGVGHYEQAHWDQAEGHFSQAIEADPNLAEAHYNLALALDHLGNHGAATESFKQAASLAPNNPDIAESPILKQHIGK